MNTFMKRFITFCICSLLFIHIAEAQHRVVDAKDETPILSAPIFDAMGDLIEFTNMKGEFSEIPSTAYPITIHCVGYENLIIERPENKVWRMTPKDYELKEVVISVQKEVLEQTFYVREYITLSNRIDTITVFMEHMVNQYIPANEKIKFKKNSLCIRNSRCYSRYKVGEIDSVATFTDSKFTFSSMLDIAKPSSRTIKAPENFKNQSGATQIYEKMGKSAMAIIQKQNAQTFTSIEDKLSDDKDHSVSIWALKLLGADISIEELFTTHVYRTNDTGVYQPKDLSQAGFVMEAIGKGKYMRRLLNSDEPIKINSTLELYIVDRQFISKEKAKEAYKNQQIRLPFKTPSSVSPLNKATQQLIQRAKAEKKNKNAENPLTQN